MSFSDILIILEITELRKSPSNLFLSQDKTCWFVKWQLTISLTSEETEILCCSVLQEKVKLVLIKLKKSKSNRHIMREHAPFRSLALNRSSSTLKKQLPICKSVSLSFLSNELELVCSKAQMGISGPIQQQGVRYYNN